MKKIAAFLLCAMLVFGTALAMTESEAWAILMQKVDSAGSAKNISIYPSKTDDGAFAVVAEKWNADTSTYASYWYVTRDDVLRLGEGDNNWTWGMACTEPDIFFNSFGEGKDRHSRAVALIDGKPVEIEDAKQVYAFLENDCGILSCITGLQNTENVFLRLILDDPQHPALAQIRAKTLTREEFLSYNGAAAAIEMIENAGYSIREYLCWDQTAFGLNFSGNGRELFTYAYMRNGEVCLRGGWWGDDIGLDEGSAHAVQNMDLPVVESK